MIRLLFCSFTIGFIFCHQIFLSRAFYQPPISLFQKRGDFLNLFSKTQSTNLHLLNTKGDHDLASDVDSDEGDEWENSVSLLGQSMIEFVDDPMNQNYHNLFSYVTSKKDLLWDQIKVEAEASLTPEPEAGPQIYQAILSQPSLLHALTQVISNELSTPSMPSTSLRNLFFEMLTPEDDWKIHMDVIAVAMRSASVGNAMMAVLFNTGLHALVCHRLSYRLWGKGRTGLSYYIQSTVSRKYSADIHPAAEIGAGIFLNVGAGVVIGETAVVGDDVSILQGVTLGGTGKERGDRHPKVGNQVILQDGSTVLGNIQIGDGAVITAKSIVTKTVPPLARVSGIPAKVKSFREKGPGTFSRDGLREPSEDEGDQKQHLRYKYLQLMQTHPEQSNTNDKNKDGESYKDQDQSGLI